MQRLCNGCRVTTLVLALLLCCAPETPEPRGVVSVDDTEQVEVPQPAEVLLRHTLDLSRHPDATCNDGTPGFFYLRPGVNPTRWLLVLQGGGACETEEICLERMETDPELYTSDPALHPETLDPGGIFSRDPSLNPRLADATHVFLRYCSSDWWTGDLGPTEANGGLAFRGHRILMAVLDTLEREHGLAAAREVLLAGMSAGGIGMSLNLDAVADELPQARVWGLQDAGIALDFASVRPEDYWEELDVDVAIDLGLTWNTPLYDGCLAETERDARCFERSFFAQRIRTPIFLRQARRDRLLREEVRAEVQRHGEVRYRGRVTDELLLMAVDEVQADDAAFVPDVSEHVVLTGDAWFEQRIAGVSAAEAFEVWADDSADRPAVWLE